MIYPITEKLISQNRSHLPLYPVGAMCHATATPGATDEAEQKYFDGGDRNASAHYFIDWDSITRCVPETEQAWHAGAHANQRFVSYELCEPREDDPDRYRKFAEVWARGVWLSRRICLSRGWGRDDLWSHAMASRKWPEDTDHTDPVGFFAQYGRTFEQFVNEVFSQPQPQPEANDVSITFPEPYQVGKYKWRVPWYDSQSAKTWVHLSYPSASDPNAPHSGKVQAVVYGFIAGKWQALQEIVINPGETKQFQQDGLMCPLEIDFAAPDRCHVGLSYVYK